MSRGGSEQLKALDADIKYYCTLKLGEYDRPEPFDVAAVKAKKVIRLPLPQEMRDDTPVNYNRQDLTLVGDIINDDFGSGMAAEVLRQSGDLAGTVIQAGAEATRMAGGKTPSVGLGLLGNLAGQALGNAFDPAAITSAIQQMTGVAPNPNPSVAFQGPELREFTLTWSFMPASEAESRRLRSIINYLKRSALPGNSITDSAAILQYPYMVQMNFYPWDNGGSGPYGWSSKSIIKMKQCFMSAVNVNYNAGAVPSFFQGYNNEPTIIQLTISFKEIEYFLRNDYGGGQGGGALDIWDKIKDKIPGLSDIPEEQEPAGDPPGNEENETDGADDT